LSSCWYKMQVYSESHMQLLFIMFKAANSFSATPFPLVVPFAK